MYWSGLKNWFEQDDFAWLGLHRGVTDLHSFFTSMFAPMAQGTIRPWSERGFFLLFYWLFGSNALPYHIAVFITQTVNLILFGLILLRLTGSRVAAVSGPILWTANSALLTPLCWASDYNQIQCAFFLLLAFYLYLREQYWWQFAIFVLGFGALELNIVYPALVLAYVTLCKPSRKAALRTVPLFLVSFAYYGLHSALAATPKEGVYSLHFDGALPATLWTYWTVAFAPVNAHQPAITVYVFTLLIAAFVAYEVWNANRLPLFFLAWTFITLAPIVPLRDHISDYYLAIPVLGLGSVFALALSHRALPVRGIAFGAVLFYLFIHVPLARFGTRWYLGHTRPVRNLVSGVRQAQKLHPGKILILTDVSDDLYLDSIAHSVFRTLDIPDVYLAPELLEKVKRLDPGNPDAPSYVLPPGPVIHAILKENLVVYSAAGERIKNVSSAYESLVGQRFGWDEEKDIPSRLDAGDPILGYLLGSTWYPPVGNVRWMPSRASFRIGVPRTAHGEIVVRGFCPPEQTEAGPLTLFVSVDGKLLSEATITKPETSFSRTFVLPSNLTGRDFVEVMLAVNRTLENPAGSPPLGLAFGVFEIN